MKLKKIVTSLLLGSTFCVLSIKGQTKRPTNVGYSADITITIKNDGTSEYNSIIWDEYTAHLKCGEVFRSQPGSTIATQLDSNGRCLDIFTIAFPTLMTRPYNSIMTSSSLSMEGNKVFLKHLEPFQGHGRDYAGYNGQQKLTVIMPAIDSYSPKNGVLKQVGEEQQVTWIFNAPENLAIEVEGRLAKEKECYVPVTPEQLRCAVPSLSLIQANKIAGELNEVMRSADTNTPARQAAFIAQSIKETTGFTRFVERGGIRYFDRYEPGTLSATNLGNTEVGDGAKFKGRGWLHLTGRDNYRRASKYLNQNGYKVDLVSNPDLIATNPEINREVSAWCWKRGRGKDFNRMADNNAIDDVTRALNGPRQYGKEERTSNYERAKNCLPKMKNCSPQGRE